MPRQNNRAVKVKDVNLLKPKAVTATNAEVATHLGFSRNQSHESGSGGTGALAGRDHEVTHNLFVHAVETFGSGTAALEWFSSQCGALKNRTPLEIAEAGEAAEVERILDCIDYGMPA